MALKFGSAAAPKSNLRSTVRSFVLAPVFAADLRVVDESKEEGFGEPKGFTIKTNFRVYNRGKTGRKHDLMGDTVIDLTNLGVVIPLNQLPTLITALQTLQDEIEEAGVLAGSGDPSVPSNPLL